MRFGTERGSNGSDEFIDIQSLPEVVGDVDNDPSPPNTVPVRYGRPPYVVASIEPTAPAE